MIVDWSCLLFGLLGVVESILQSTGSMRSYFLRPVLVSLLVDPVPFLLRHLGNPGYAHDLVLPWLVTKVVAESFFLMAGSHPVHTVHKTEKRSTQPKPYRVSPKVLQSLCEPPDAITGHPDAPLRPQQTAVIFLAIEVQASVQAGCAALG